MKYLKTFKKYKFKKGALVKLTSEAIDDFIFNITKYSHKYPKTQMITKEELKNKIFYISKIEELSSVDDDTVEYNLINIDPDDKFFLGWYIRK
jgi:hypothetical protein